jgi:membrane-associated phospholipid phosphatase
LHSILRFLTDFGDTAVTVPLAIVMAAFLFAARQRRLAIAWALVIALCAGATGALKLALRICGHPLSGSTLTGSTLTGSTLTGSTLTGSTLNSPSGHTAMSIAVYGGIAIIVGSTLGPTGRGALFYAAVTFAFAIAASRALIGVHSPIEVAVGLAVGLVTLPVVMAVTLRYRPTSLPLQWLAAGAFAVFLLFHGTRWPAEQAIHHLARWLDILRPYCS